MPKRGFGLFVAYLCLGYGHALAEQAPRVRAASAVQQIASEVLPYGNGHHPMTPGFCGLPDSERIVAVWQAIRFDLTEHLTRGIWWRYFSSTLAPLTAPTPIGPDEQGIGSRNELFPSCLSTDDGGFMAIWEHRLGGFPDSADIWGQVFSTAGDPATEEGLLTAETSAEEYAPEIVRTVDGNLLIAWTSFNADYLRYQVFMRRLDEMGNPLGDDEHVVGTGAASEPNRELVKVSSNGTSVVAAWSEVVPARDEFPIHEGIFARPLLGDAPAVMVSEPAGSEDLCADFAMNTSGGVVLWVSSDKVLRLRQIDQDAQPIGPVRTLDEIPEGFIADGPVVAAAPDGSSYLAVWGVDDQEAEEVILWARLLDSHAVPLGGRYMVERIDSSGGFLNKLRFPAVAYVSANSIVVGWEYFKQPPGPVADLEVHVQLLEIGNMEQTCGDADDDGFVTTNDALTVLRAAVHLSNCVTCFCDINGSGKISAIDSLAALRASVDLPVALKCPDCEPE